MAPINVFAAMMAGAKKSSSSATQPTPTPSAPSTTKSSSATDQPAAIPAAAPMFAPKVKGSGLGSGPKHRVEEKDQPWVEKYRPKNLEEVSAQDHTVAVLKKTLGSSNLPHMLFYGPPGTGKTSTILALCKQLFGPELYRSRVLELNASDERGITVVREKIKAFAKTTVTTNHDPNYPAPPYKIIILDEADSMTQDAQSALRRIMENHSRITRFCLICNYVTRIIEPITSRCSKFRFKPLDVSSTETRLREICLKESVECPDEALAALIKTSDGDLRRAITYLQSASRLHAADKTPLTAISVQEIGGVVPDHIMKSLVRALGVDVVEEEDEDVDMEVDLDEEKRGPFELVQRAVERVTREGYSATQILIQLHDLLILDPLIPARAKASIALALGEVDKVLTDGADEELQLLSVCARIRKAVVGKEGKHR
ncbi:P-loop containing nucleoside triphosphate hydrolase protein [Meredithblackwellia eburnea MCA 4105]